MYMPHFLIFSIILLWVELCVPSPPPPLEIKSHAELLTFTTSECVVANVTS